MDTLDLFAHPQYMIRRKVFKLFGGAFHVFDDAGNVVLYSRMKAFKLKEDIRLYASEAMEEELLIISARQMLDIAATYDVIDPAVDAKVGALRRKGLKSMFRDEWHILDENDEQIGMIQEDSTGLAVLRRVIDLAKLVLPQKFTVTIDGTQVAEFRQQFNPFIFRMDVDFTPDQQAALDRRLGLAAAVLIVAIEGRQQ